jgi:hypothetical protein
MRLRWRVFRRRGGSVGLVAVYCSTVLQAETIRFDENSVNNTCAVERYRSSKANMAL